MPAMIVRDEDRPGGFFRVTYVEASTSRLRRVETVIRKSVETYYTSMLSDPAWEQVISSQKFREFLATHETSLAQAVATDLLAGNFVVVTT